MSAKRQVTIGRPGGASSRRRSGASSEHRSQCAKQRPTTWTPRRARSPTSRPAGPGRTTTASALAAATVSLCLCHGCDRRADRVAVTAGHPRVVGSLQPTAADRRPRIRGVAIPRTGAAACRRGVGNVDRKRPHYFRERGEVRRGGIRSPAVIGALSAWARHIFRPRAERRRTHARV
jgi:hypothetical protein